MTTYKPLTKEDVKLICKALLGAGLLLLGIYLVRA